MADNTIGQAYLQIKPSMEGMSNELKQAMGEEGEKSSASFGASFASGLKKVGVVAGAAVAGAATGVAKLTKTAVSSFAEYEQLVGGVDTLFGDSANIVAENAAQAFKTAGMSANAYMETVTSFSASLLQSLGGDTEQAASVADMAIRDMSDNANKMGTSMESIQNAYQGFAKQNYTMLDNLKLGYGGTKTEMERLLADASELAGVEFNIDSLSDVYEAINVIQTNLGITGTTALEASDTISGSFGSVSAAWQNLITGFANGDADLSVLVQQLAETATTAIGNMIPTISQALVGIGQALEILVPVIADELPAILDAILPSLISAAMSLLNAFVKALPQILSILIEQLPTIFETIVNTILDMLPLIFELGLQLIMALANGLIDALPELIPKVVDVIFAIVDKLTDPDTLVMLIEAALELIIALATGIIDALPRLIEKAPEIVVNLAKAIIKAAPKILEAAVELIFKLIEGLVSMFGKLIEVGANIVNSVKDGFMEKVEAAKNWGKDLIENFINGIKEKWEHLKQTVSNVANTVKEFLGFSEPEKGPLANFHTFAPDMMELFAQGIRQNVGLVQSAIGDVASGIKSDFSVTSEAVSDVRYRQAPQIDSRSDVYGLLAEYLPRLRDGQTVEVKLVGDAAGIFRAVRNENKTYIQRTGMSAFV